MKLIYTKYILFILLMSSCASNGFLMAKAHVSLYESTFPTKAPNSKIEIFRTKLPIKEYTEVGEITCADTNQEWALEQILVKAREIGADGIIILGDAGNYTVGVPIGNIYLYTGSRGYGVKAIAIKYINI